MKTSQVINPHQKLEFIYRLIISITLLSILVLNACVILAQDENMLAEADIQVEKSNPEISKEQVNNFYEAAKRELNANNLYEAQRFLIQSLGFNPEHALSYGKMGQVYAKQRDFRKSIEYFDKAISIDKTNPEFFYNRALAKTYLDKIESSIADCDQAIRLNPEFAEAYLVRGISKAMVGDMTSSMDDLKKSIALKNDYGEVYYNIGLNYLESGETGNAKSNFKKAFELGYKIENLTAYLNR